MSSRETARLAPNSGAPMVQRFHQSMQSVAVSLVLGVGNIVSAPPNGASIHSSGATEKIPAWFVHVVSSRHPFERLCHEVSDSA